MPSIDRAEACADLLRRWLRTFGPATLTDIRWWTGWTARLTKGTLEALGAVDVSLDESTGYVLRLIEAERDRLQDWLGDTRVRPRFPSPLERSLWKAADVEE